MSWRHHVLNYTLFFWQHEGWKKDEDDDDTDSLAAEPWGDVLTNFTTDTSMHGIRFYTLQMDRRLIVVRR